MSEDLHRACRLVARAEREIRLLARCQPTNFASEARRLRALWLAGRTGLPALSHAPVLGLATWRRVLESLAGRYEPSCPVSQLLRERATELCIEAELAECIGTARFRHEAARRFPEPKGALRKRCDAFLSQWGRLRESKHDNETAASDDLSCPWSLVTVLSEAIGRLRLPIRVLRSASLVSTAATADAVIYVREGARLTREAARRIALHELAAHALPRHWASQGTQPLLAMGTAGASDDEEGRALLLEDRFALMDAGRSAELAYRHCACQAMRDSAEWGDMLRLLTGLGATVDQAVLLGLRALRGGGLGRELVYLPRFFAVSDAFERTPRLEAWFELGKVSLRAAELFEGAGEGLGAWHAAARASQEALVSLLLPARRAPERGRMASPPSARLPRSRLPYTARAVPH